MNQAVQEDLTPPNRAARADKVVLEIRDLQTHFRTQDGVVKAVDGLSYTVREGETLGVVGESGCGKSVTALSILRLIPDPPGKIVGGAIEFEGLNLVDLPEEQMEAIRGNDISMIFQEPMTALNPLYRIGHQISEALALHRGLSKREARAVAVDMLRRVSIPEPESRVDSYPHQLSGGMRQRVMIAMALCLRAASILIADEPTTALDVTIQAQILESACATCNEKTRDGDRLHHPRPMGVVAENADRVVVMYAGRKVEEAPVDELFNRPSHPYTRGLLGSIPKLDEVAYATGDDRPRLNEIPGMVPALTALPPGCTFAPRCTFASEKCHQSVSAAGRKMAGIIG